MKKVLNVFIPPFMFIFLTSTIQGKKEKIFQIDISKIANARSVTTLTNGKLITWSKGIDGNGKADGYLTMAASLFNGDKEPKALPDNPLFPGNDKHPAVLLHYSNNDSMKNQTVAVSKQGSFQFEVSPMNYSAFYLALTSAEGASQLTVNFYYTDGTQSKSFDVPDYYKDIPPNDPDFCYLAYDLAKWGTKNNMTEKDHHNIDLLNIHPDPNRQLTKIQVEKAESGYLVFWGATGVGK